MLKTSQNPIDAPELADISSLDRVAYSQKVGVFRSLWQKPRCEERVRDRDDRSASANPAKPSSSQPGQPAEPSEAARLPWLPHGVFFFLLLFVPPKTSESTLRRRLSGRLEDLAAACRLPGSQQRIAGTTSCKCKTRPTCNQARDYTKVPKQMDAQFESLAPDRCLP